MAPPDGARTVDLPGGVHAAWSDASRGDLRPSGQESDGTGSLALLAGELASASGDPVTRVAWATQVHGIQVRDAYPDSPSDGTAAAAPPAVTHLGEGDALVSSRGGVAVCVLTADCGALALSSPEGIFAAVHAGWRGLVGGVVEAAVAHMRQLGSTDVVGSLGPCIHAECYEFSTHDLDEVAAACGPGVRGRTSDGRPALDLTAGIISSLAKAGAVVAPGVDICTACGDGYFSHRVRRDSGRQALLVWGGSTARPS